MFQMHKYISYSIIYAIYFSEMIVELDSINDQFSNRKFF
jgi:hypothetical protein